MNYKSLLKSVDFWINLNVSFNLFLTSYTPSLINYCYCFLNFSWDSQTADSAEVLTAQTAIQVRSNWISRCFCEKVPNEVLFVNFFVLVALLSKVDWHRQSAELRDSVCNYYPQQILRKMKIEICRLALTLLRTAVGFKR